MIRTILGMSLGASVMALALWLGRPLLKKHLRPSLCYGLWLLVLLRFCVPLPGFLKLPVAEERETVYVTPAPIPVHTYAPAVNHALLPTPDPRLAADPGPAPTATPRPTLMPVTANLPEGAWMASVENIDADSSLNLRAQPSTGAEILMRLYLHQPLIVLEESEVPGWVHVRTDQAEGYVMLSFLRELSPQEP